MQVTISSIEEYINETLKIHSNNEKYNIKRENNLHIGLAFRGQSDKNYELIPAIGRKDHSKNQVPILYQEETLIEMAKYKLPNIFGNNLQPLDLLALLQHYGIPTRLLDVTSNPLVALYFAAKDTTTDGEVIVFEYWDDFRMLYPFANAIAETYKCYNHIPLQSFYIYASKQPYFYPNFSYNHNHDSTFDSEYVKHNCENFLLFVNPTEQLERQKKQQGFFIIFPNRIIEFENEFWFTNEILPIDKNSDKVKKRIIIKKEAKETIQSQLRFLGVSEYTLFSDNIDIVCKGIVKECKRIKE